MNRLSLLVIYESASLKQGESGILSPPLPQVAGINSLELPSLSSFLNGNGYGYSHTNHGVVTCTDETHHLNVSRN